MNNVKTSLGDGKQLAGPVLVATVVVPEALDQVLFSLCRADENQSEGEPARRGQKPVRSRQEVRQDNRAEGEVEGTANPSIGTRDDKRVLAPGHDRIGQICTQGPDNPDQENGPTTPSPTPDHLSQIGKPTLAQTIHTG